MKLKKIIFFVLSYVFLTLSSFLFAANDFNLVKPVNNELRVLTWNLFTRPYIVSHDGQFERLKEIVKYIHDLAENQIDILVFQEAFMLGRYHSRFLKALTQQGFTNSTSVLGSTHEPFKGVPFRLTNGGVFIASRWPMIERKETIFRECTKTDCIASKGVVYAAIKKEVNGQNNTYHIFGTHLQSLDITKAKEIRIKQAKHLQSFIAKQEISIDDAVIIAGDLNADYYGTQDHALEVLSLLKGTLPTRTGLLRFSIAPNLNSLVGESGEARAKGCHKEYVKTRFCSCCNNSYLDYILYSHEHKKPSSSEYKIFKAVTKTSFPVCMSAKLQPFHVRPYSPLCGLTWLIKDLSDHYPVLAKFRF